MSQALVTQIQTTFDTLNIEELRRMSGLPEEVFNELQELGVLDEFMLNGETPANTVLVFKKAARLRRSFQLDANSLALLIHFIGETHQLQDQIRRIYRTHPYL